MLQLLQRSGFAAKELLFDLILVNGIQELHGNSPVTPSHILRDIDGAHVARVRLASKLIATSNKGRWCLRHGCLNGLTLWQWRLL
jgi:hypothetical protein